MNIDVISARKARSEDCRRIWEWANDPETRARSFDFKPIPWESHVAWFQQKLIAPHSSMYITELGKEPVGLIRFDPDENHPGDCFISISIAPNQRGLKRAAPSLIAAIRAHSYGRVFGRIHAYIKPDNQASIKAFERADFRFVENVAVRGNTAMHYIFSAEKPI